MKSYHVGLLSIVGCVTVAGTIAGCSYSMPIPVPGSVSSTSGKTYSFPDTNIDEDDKYKAYKESEPGIRYCLTVELAARSQAKNAVWQGVLLAGGAFAAGTAGAHYSLSDSTDKESRAWIGAGLAGTALALGAASIYLLGRAGDNSQAAASAAIAMGERRDEDRIRACNAAVAAWHSGRGANARYIQQRLVDRVLPAASSRASETPPTPTVPTGSEAAPASSKLQVGWRGRSEARARDRAAALEPLVLRSQPRCQPREDRVEVALAHDRRCRQLKSVARSRTARDRGARTEAACLFRPT